MSGTNPKSGSPPFAAGVMPSVYWERQYSVFIKMKVHHHVVTYPQLSSSEVVSADFSTSCEIGYERSVLRLSSPEVGSRHAR